MDGMTPIETLEDIVEQLADKLAVYGACNENHEYDDRGCRCCWTANLERRIRDAVEIERRLGRD
jgi:hypothetical protein